MAYPIVPTEDNQKSGFNEASLKMLRLHKIQIFIFDSKASNDMYRYFDGLTGLYKEIVGKLTDEEMNIAEKFVKDISLRLSDIMQVKIRRVIIPHGNNLDSLLFDFDCWLRRMMDKHGFSVNEAQDTDSF